NKGSALDRWRRNCRRRESRGQTKGQRLIVGGGIAGNVNHAVKQTAGAWSVRLSAPDRRQRVTRPLLLPPGQSFGFPSGGPAAVALIVHRPLEPVRDIVDVGETVSERGLCRRRAAAAGAAHEVDMVLRRESGLLQLIDERGVALHG